MRSQLEGKLDQRLGAVSESILQALERGEAVPPCPDELQVLYRSSVLPYLRSWFQYEPKVESAKLLCSQLWLWGDADEQLPSEWRYLRNGQEYVCFADMNHAMRNIKTPTLLHTELIKCVQEFCK